MHLTLGEWASLVQIIQFIIVVIALLVARQQKGEASKARQLNATNILIEQIGNPRIREIRSWFIHNFKGSPSEDDLDKIRVLAVCYDRVGLMIRQKLLPEDALYVWQNDEIRNLWQAIKPYVEAIRTQYHRPNYCYHFQYLATVWLKKMDEKNARHPLIEQLG